MTVPGLVGILDEPWTRSASVAQHPAYAEALRGLAAADMIRPRRHDARPDADAEELS